MRIGLWRGAMPYYVCRSGEARHDVRFPTNSIAELKKRIHLDDVSNRQEAISVVAIMESKSDELKKRVRV